MFKKNLLKIINIILFTIIILFFSGCIDNIDEPKLPSRGFFMGILPTPANEQEISDAYIQASQYSELIPVWSSGTGASGFWDYADKLNGWWGKTFLNNYIRGNGMFPIIHFSFIDKNENGELILKSPDDLPNATLSDPDWRSLYTLSVIDVVNIVRPSYLSIGNEVNRWYEQYGIDEDNPNGFQHYVSLYEEIYDIIKEISPNTKIFCVFAREIVSENREAELDVLKMFDKDKIDVLVFTTYPISVQGINLPSDIPDDYYLIASEYMPNKPFGFSEIGWPSYDLAGGEKGQYNFLINISDHLTTKQGISLHIFMYCWLHDLEQTDTNGLIKRR